MSLKKSKVLATPAARKRVMPMRKAAVKAATMAAAKASKTPGATVGKPAARKPVSAKAAVQAKAAKHAPKAVPAKAAKHASKAVPAKAAKPAAKPAPVKERSVRSKTPPDNKAKAHTAAKPQPVVHFNDADLREFRNLLTKLRNDLVRKVTYLRDSSLRREDDVNHSEDGSDAFDRLFSLERAGGVQQRIYAIDEALREIDEGTYGICQSCESLIRKQRLLALPFARNCIDCQSAQERRRDGPGAARATPRRFVP